MGMDIEPGMGTPALARALCRSVASDPLQSACVLGALAATAFMLPIAALPCAAAGAAFAVLRPKPPTHDLLGHDAAEVVRMDRGFSLPLGRETRSGRPIVLSSDDARQHLLVLGTTGSAKTEALLGMSEAALAQGSGLLFVDGKGDPSLVAKAWAMAKRLGRIDDLLLLDLTQAPAQGSNGRDAARTNTMNPFGTESATGLVQLILGLADWPDEARRRKAGAMLTGVMGALVHLRDLGRAELDAGVVAGNLGLVALLGLRSAQDVPEPVRARIDAYLGSLPGYNLERGSRQAQAVQERHAEIERPLAEALAAFADAYAHAFRHHPADIDLADVVSNRRILVVLLPALEKAQGEFTAVSRLVPLALKELMARTLVQGDRGPASGGSSSAMHRLGDPPFLCVFDSLGHYLVDGLALMAARARLLGFCMVYADDDIPSLRRGSEREAASIIANTSTKVFMRTEAVSDGFGTGPDGQLTIPGLVCGRDDEPVRWNMPVRTEAVDLSRFRAGDILVVHRHQKLWGRCVWRDEASVPGQVRVNHYVRMQRP